MNRFVSIKEILDLEVFKDAYLLSPRIGLNNKVDNITIMDIPDITNWLTANDLLIIGQSLKHYLNIQLIEKLRQCNISGIITKNKFEEGISKEVANLCTEYKIPFIICNDKYSWSQIMTPIQQRIYQHQNIILEDNVTFYNKLIESITKKGSLSTLCNEIFNISGLSLAMIDQNSTLIDATNDFDWIRYLKDFRSNYLVQQEIIGYDFNGQPFMGIKYLNPYLKKTHEEILLFPVYFQGKSIGYVLLKKM
ncbi:PucR family transcriptional regulator ligand-binding domain-containing protein [Vagococcus elongatus]|uniref:Purine catabolism PurC-like domain-containing protein n=1 Tax=Vagococcus elongatus TaxID=180344 RepID=A0A430AI12_9ENTE|nr:PucR family transcriptional regulator ligand-binding domain-containing protein [Vagococcus elongatus]RSU07634.1 hypothetical protein CBF29_13345 [Vagococcus elongatus]